MHALRGWAAGMGLVLVVVGCAASQGGAGGAQPSSYKKDLGTAALTVVVRQVPKILNRHQFEIDREDSSPSLLTIRTRWSERFPFEDEKLEGVEEARTRLVLTARARARSGGTADVRVVDMLAENMVLVGDSAAWRQDLMTPMFRAFIDRIAEELKVELQSGIRVY